MKLGSHIYLRMKKVLQNNSYQIEHDLTGREPSKNSYSRNFFFSIIFDSSKKKNHRYRIVLPALFDD